MNKIIRIFPDPGKLAENIADELYHFIKGKNDIENSSYLVLAGGKTPRLVYEHWTKPIFRGANLWQTVHFFWGDERCVPPQHPDSNFGMARSAFLPLIPIPATNIHRIRGENDPVMEVHRYEQEIYDHVPRGKDGMPQFDWIFLGLGTDGHTASLFPGSPAFQEQDSLCSMSRHPQSGQTRISLTLPVINHTQRVSFIVTGEEKAAIVKKIVGGESGDPLYPAARVQPVNSQLEWFLDIAAAKLLTR